MDFLAGYEELAPQVLKNNRLSKNFMVSKLRNGRVL